MTQRDAHGGRSIMTRTRTAAATLVAAVQADIGEIVDALTVALEKARALQEAGAGVNGLETTCRAQSAAIKAVIDVYTEESADIAKKMLREPREPVTQYVDTDRLEQVRKMRAVP
jgi:hypothetical protein